MPAFEDVTAPSLSSIEDDVSLLSSASMWIYKVESSLSLVLSSPSNLRTLIKPPNVTETPAGILVRVFILC